MSDSTKTIYLNVSLDSSSAVVRNLSSQTVTLTANSFTAPDISKYFHNWDTVAAGGGTVASDGGSFIPQPAIAYNGSYTITLYAQWATKEYNVEYYTNGTKLGSSHHVYGTAKNLTAFSTFSPSEVNTTTNWQFRGWATGPDNGEYHAYTYADQASVKNLTDVHNGVVKLYAVYERTIYIYSGVNKATSSSATQYWNSYGDGGNSSVTFPKLGSISNWKALGYRQDTSATTATFAATETGGVIAYPTVLGSNYLYGVYSRQYTATFYSGLNKATVKTKNSNFKYYNSSSSTLPTTVSITTDTAANSTDINNWSESGWRSNTDAATKEYDYNKAVTVAFGTNFYSIYTRTITISYNGNTNTGGSTSNTTKTLYLNTNSTTMGDSSGSTDGAKTITLRKNGFTKTGYTFVGWTGTGLNSATKNVTISNNVGNRSYTANWSKNYYIVNYYVNGNLWTQRSVGYNDNLENLNAQSLLDVYHKFHGWTGWVDKMPNHDVNLYANITESYCALITGHGQYGNATALLNVFRSAGWSGTVVESPHYPGNYQVVTDYNLTRAQAEIQKNYIAEHTNYTNYNYPYLYWVAVDCTNGIGTEWTRSVGQKNFN